MSPLPVHAMAPERLAELRSQAAARLTGAAASKGPSARATDALTVLHALASAPETAMDALALLHELQLHQVELELQAQELRDSRAVLEAALQRQGELYDSQPMACFTIDRRTALLEMNRAGAAMLGIASEEARGRLLHSFLATGGHPLLLAALSQVESSGGRRSCLLRLATPGGLGQRVVVSIGRDVTACQYLVGMAGLDDGETRDAD